MKPTLAFLILFLTASTFAATSGSVVTLTIEDPNPPEIKVVKYVVDGKRAESPTWQTFGETADKVLKLTNLTAGTWIFVARAVTDIGLLSPESEPSAPLVVSSPIVPVAVSLKATITYTIDVP